MGKKPKSVIPIKGETSSAWSQSMVALCDGTGRETSPYSASHVVDVIASMRSRWHVTPRVQHGHRVIRVMRGPAR